MKSPRKNNAVQQTQQASTLTIHELIRFKKKDPANVCAYKVDVFVDKTS